MAKAKTPGGVPNRPLYSRVSFLYQAAAYLASPPQQPPARQPPDRPSEEAGAQAPARGPPAQLQGAARRLLTDLRAVGQKTLIRVSPEVKRTVCKACDTLLVPGRTCTSAVENKSRGGRKPWADVLVVTCGACGGEKRFPMSAPRQKRRALREAEAQRAAKEAGGG